MQRRLEGLGDQESTFLGLEGGFSEEKSADREGAKLGFAQVGDGGVVLSNAQSLREMALPAVAKTFELGAGFAPKSAASLHGHKLAGSSWSLSRYCLFAAGGFVLAEH